MSWLLEINAEVTLVAFGDFGIRRSKIPILSAVIKHISMTTNCVDASDTLGLPTAGEFT